MNLNAVGMKRPRFDSPQEHPDNARRRRVQIGIQGEPGHKSEIKKGCLAALAPGQRVVNTIESPTTGDGGSEEKQRFQPRGYYVKQVDYPEMMWIFNENVARGRDRTTINLFDENFFTLLKTEEPTEESDQFVSYESEELRPLFGSESWDFLRKPFWDLEPVFGKDGYRSSYYELPDIEKVLMDVEELLKLLFQREDMAQEAASEAEVGLRQLHHHQK